MTVRSLKLVLFAALGSVVFFLYRPLALAASSAPAGIVVSPAFQQSSIPAGADKQPVYFTVTNNKPSVQKFKLSVADFNTLGETGGLFFVGANPTELQKKYGLATWLELPTSSLVLQPKQTVKVSADILNLGTLSPGGHYGALMVSPDDGTSGATTNNVSVHPIASSLLFVTKLGGDTHKLGLSGVDVKHTLFSLPSSVTLRFHNDGNTHVTPRGTVTLSTPQGRVIGRGIINEDSNIVLPETYRQLSVPLKKVASAYATGRYVLNVSFRFDGINQYRQYQTSFLYFPVLALIILVVILAVVAALAHNRLLRRR
jgi:hypothetical protein